MKNQIKLLLVLIVGLTCFSATAQWSGTGDIYYSAGKVGVGTSAPFSSLHVWSNEDAITWPATISNSRNNSTISNYGVGLMLKHSSNNETYKWGGVASIQETGWANASGLALYANEKEYVRIKNNGHVGIGTTNPYGKLEISTDVHSNSLLTLRDTHYSPNQIYHFQIQSDGLKIKQDNTVNYQFKSGGDFIVNNGEMGIGTYEPLAKLDIVGPATGSSYLNNPTLKVSAGSTSGRAAMWLDTQSDNATDFVFRSNGIGRVWFSSRASNENHDFRIYMNPDENGGPEVTAMSITQNGNIGIGTTNTHGYKLAVAGKVISEEVKVQLQNAWPDYVFSKNYNLKTLEETETYIQENQHLPEIPSAQEVEENGILLGEMNAKLLQKIEELTLHLIDQNKKNEVQNEQIQVLTKRLNDLESK